MTVTREDLKFEPGSSAVGLVTGGKYTLQTILLAGSPSMPETFAWFYEAVKRDLWVTSQSGGTEVVSALVAASPTLPVYAGEIQARALASYKCDVVLFPEFFSVPLTGRTDLPLTANGERDVTSRNARN